MARRNRRRNNNGGINLTKRQDNNRRTSSPRTSEEQREAIKNDIESEILAMARQIFLEKGLDRLNLAKVLGVGGVDNLSFFEGSFEEGYSDINSERTDSNYPYGYEKEEAPDFKRVTNLINQQSNGDINQNQTNNQTRR